MSFEKLKEFILQNDDEIEEKPSKAMNNKAIHPLNAASVRKQQREEYYKAITENIRKSERMRSRINKAIKNSEDIEDLLYMCLECIYLMTGDSTSYKQNINILKDRV